ncbi:cytochrome-c oxidase, cbb3-type subunit III [Teredinibacter sp. KSP-S5-2]|uniref:cytochrome-c oxidase, cbb3-type subunit III n=1 Tax=Teredinibacter sp. KSP-S5-2 TaxID=3034506 RepID=UPI0029351CE5|nr:cytochrome-c oxidase, cbb3-type subunit III [Teredinibacter sp. KSP-S5-2]WNO10201.1 cytochrome-c oxidase, cbb3-type subunit III [Teredinibacter sp. KSP-S5-2]
MSTFWSLWIIVLTVVCLALVTWVLFANRKVAVSDDEEPENRTTGHVYDGIEEYDNPLPRWWFNLFVATLVFTVAYLIWFPGLGAWKGIGGWTQENQLEAEQGKALEEYKSSYDVYSQMSIEELVHDGKAMKMATRLFANNCAVCHGADGGGNFSFPNLTDNDWLYGGSPEAIKHTLTQGRNGNMPPWGPILGEQKVAQVSEYVLKLSSQDYDLKLATEGESVFSQNCAACHGAEGKGMHALGAPNLTDNIWLYDGSREGIIHSVRMGLNNHMPAQKDLLREEKIHLLTAYVYSLSFEYE